MIVPQDAFITFENEEGFLRASKIETKKVCNREEAVVVWRDTNVDMKLPKEPSNIIYRNLYQEKRGKCVRKTVTYLVLAFALLSSCIVLFMTQKVSINLAKYFPDVNCDTLKHDLQNDTDMMIEYAYLEWFYYMTMDKQHISIEEISTQNLHCYCDDLQAEKGFFNAVKIEHT